MFDAIFIVAGLVIMVALLIFTIIITFLYWYINRVDPWNRRR